MSASSLASEITSSPLLVTRSAAPTQAATVARAARTPRVPIPAFTGIPEPAFTGIPEPAFTGIPEPAFTGISSPGRPRIPIPVFTDSATTTLARPRIPVPIITRVSGHTPSSNSTPAVTSRVPRCQDARNSTQDVNSMLDNLTPAKKEIMMDWAMDLALEMDMRFNFTTENASSTLDLNAADQEVLMDQAREFLEFGYQIGCSLFPTNGNIQAMNWALKLAAKRGIKFSFNHPVDSPLDLSSAEQKEVQDMGFKFLEEGCEFGSYDLPEESSTLRKSIINSNKEKRVVSTATSLVSGPPSSATSTSVTVAEPIRYLSHAEQKDIIDRATILGSRINSKPPASIFEAVTVSRAYWSTVPPLVDPSRPDPDPNATYGLSEAQRKYLSLPEQVAYVKWATALVTRFGWEAPTTMEYAMAFVEQVKAEYPDVDSRPPIEDAVPSILPESINTEGINDDTEKGAENRGVQRNKWCGWCFINCAHCPGWNVAEEEAPISGPLE
jgi:hypothetical protein